MKCKATVGLFGPGDLEEYHESEVEGNSIRVCVDTALGNIGTSHARAGFNKFVSTIQVTLEKLPEKRPKTK